MSHVAPLQPFWESDGLYTDGQRGASRNAGEDRRRTHVHLVLERQDAGWKIVHTAIMDAR
jgi:hypothetical protein